MVPLKTPNTVFLNALYVIMNVSFSSFASVVGYPKFM